MQHKNKCSADHRGFTLVELMAVVAVVALLAATILPALAGAKTRTSVQTCIDNQRQLAVAWSEYADDNKGSIVDPGTSSGSWRVMFTSPLPPGGPTAQDTVKNWDEAGYKAGELYRYAKDLSVIHCPADSRARQDVGPAWVSYSALDTTSSALNSPSTRFLWMEEDDRRVTTFNGWTVGQNFGSWALQNNSASSWWDAPGVFHITGTVFSYADGHVAIHRWQDDATLRLASYPKNDKATLALQVTPTSSPTGAPLHTDGLGSPHDLPFMATGYGP